MERLKAYRVFLAMSAAQALAMATMFTTGTVYYVNGIGLQVTGTLKVPVTWETEMRPFSWRKMIYLTNIIYMI